MTETILTNRHRPWTVAVMRRTIVVLAAAVGTATLPACVNVTAPDKPIEINLNISVTAETVVKFDAQAKSLIQQNPGIF